MAWTASEPSEIDETKYRWNFLDGGKPSGQLKEIAPNCGKELIFASIKIFKNCYFAQLSLTDISAREQLETKAQITMKWLFCRVFLLKNLTDYIYNNKSICVVIVDQNLGCFSLCLCFLDTHKIN